MTESPTEQPPEPTGNLGSSDSKVQSSDPQRWLTPGLKQAGVVLVAVIGAMGTIALITYGAFDVGRGVTEGALESSRTDAKRLQAEADNLRTQLATARRNAAAASENDSGAKSGSAASNTQAGSGARATSYLCLASNTKTPFTTVFPNEGALRVCVTAGSGIELDGGALAISVVAVDFGGEPPRDRVTGVIDGTSGKAIVFRNQDVGATFRYGKYRVRIVNVDTFSATFSVRRSFAGG